MVSYELKWITVILTTFRREQVRSVKSFYYGYHGQLMAGDVDKLSRLSWSPPEKVKVQPTVVKPVKSPEKASKLLQPGWASGKERSKVTGVISGARVEEVVDDNSVSHASAAVVPAATSQGAVATGWNVPGAANPGFPPPEFFMAQMQAYQKMMEQIQCMSRGVGVYAENDGAVRRSDERSHATDTSPRPPPSTLRLKAPTRAHHHTPASAAVTNDDAASRKSSTSPRPTPSNRDNSRSRSPRPTPHNRETSPRPTPSNRSVRSRSPRPTNRGPSSPDISATSELRRDLQKLDVKIEKKGYGEKYLQQRRGSTQQQHESKKRSVQKKSARPKPTSVRNYDDDEDDYFAQPVRAVPRQNRRDREMSEMDALEANYRHGR